MQKKKVNNTIDAIVFRLAALALLVLQDEEDAFWCLVVIVDYIMPPHYYTKDLVGCQVRTL